MSRLVISKQTNNTLCVIKNFATFELEDTFLRITDKSGLTEINIFDITFDGNSYNLKIDKHSIIRSNEYYSSVHNGDKCWALHSRTWLKIVDVIIDHTRRILNKAVETKTLNLNGITLTYSNNKISIISSKYQISDNFIINRELLSAYHSQYFLIGLENIVVIKYYNKCDLFIQKIHDDEHVFPKKIYVLTLNTSTSYILNYFIAKCLNTLKEQEKYLSVGLSSLRME